MPDFFDYFVRSKGMPFTYKGITTYLSDGLIIPHPGAFCLSFESASSNLSQGVRLRAHSGIVLADNSMEPDLIFWMQTSPSVIRLAMAKCDEKLTIYNAWHFGNPDQIEAGHGGAAMRREPLQNGFRYCCNDFAIDDDFDDLIFSISWP